MLDELAVTDLGVIPRLSLTLGPGMTALTGETGAGKTMVVEAIELLLGGRADSRLVRPGAEEATVEGRFSEGDDEWVIRRVIPRHGRSRAYVNGNLASTAELTELGHRLVDLHGQHAQQSLLQPATQRRALDLFGGVDLDPLRSATTELARIDRSLAELGGDERARTREADLLRFQLNEIDEAAVASPQEDEELRGEEDRLADAVAHQEAAALAHDALSGDGGAAERLADAIAALGDRGPFAELSQRARGLAAELVDLAGEVRDRGETIEPDPERLAEVQQRRRLLTDLRRKFGDTLADVLDEADRLRSALEELDGREGRAAELQQRRGTIASRLRVASAAVHDARRAAAPRLAKSVQAHLVDLALPKARLSIEVGEEAPGDDVTFLLAANPGAPLLPLAKVASGGELARAMLALRLVLSRSGYTSPPTQVFDEVDAGIGGAAATAVGEALARLAGPTGSPETRQILVVTHLPQVAAWAGTQVTVEKSQGDATTVSEARVLTEEERAVELARMLSGSPDSELARRHATELLGGAAAARARF